MSSHSSEYESSYQPTCARCKIEEATNSSFCENCASLLSNPNYPLSENETELVRRSISISRMREMKMQSRVTGGLPTSRYRR